MDPAALEGWLLAQPVERGLYRMEIKPEVRSLQALFKESGEIPPGCEVEVSRESINIEATAPQAAILKKGA